MPILSLDAISYAIGHRTLLKDATLHIEAGERVCLLGRNGAGKSTLFRIIRGVTEPESGTVDRTRDLCISELEQSLPDALDCTVTQYVTGGLVVLRQSIDEYQALSAAAHAPTDLRRLQELQHVIEAGGGWQIDTIVATMLSELDLPPERALASLSGGWRRRAALARALVGKPDLLLLDEPTNHLDLSTVEWLERRVATFPGAVLFITHDRAFMQHLATRIVELDRGRLSSWPGDYQDFLRRKLEWLDAEARANREFDRKLADEEAWIRQGVKARRTRNEGRVRALDALRQDYAQRVMPEKTARIHIEEAELSGRKVIEARSLRHGYGDALLIDGLTIKITRGDRIGLIGNNGVGKSTLLRILLGELAPHSGTVKHGTNLEIGYFDQLRRELDPQKTVAEIVGEGREYIKLGGKDRHVIGYLAGFLFSAERAMTKIGVLSGGECNRVILARLLARPSNLLVLDEPTNDLDVETLEVLEARLSEYSGTLIVVSHDREFLDNVVTSILVFEDSNTIQHYVGGYSDWRKRGRHLQERDDPRSTAPAAVATAAPPAAPRGRHKLSYNLQRELDALPQRIADLERTIADLTGQMSAPEFYQQPYTAVQPVLDALAATQVALDAALVRWDALESQATAYPVLRDDATQ